jgi:hypothetical protein
MPVGPEQTPSHVEVLAREAMSHIEDELEKNRSTPEIAVSVWPEPVPAEGDPPHVILPADHLEALALLKQAYEAAGWDVVSDIGEDAYHRTFTPTLTLIA